METDTNDSLGNDARNEVNENMVRSFIYFIRFVRSLIAQTINTTRQKRPFNKPINAQNIDITEVLVEKKDTRRQRSGKATIKKRFPLQKPKWEKTIMNNQVLIP